MAEKIWEVHDPDRPNPTKISTEGAVKIAPPTDAIVLFDGKDLSEWEQKNGTEALWKIKDQILIAAKSGGIQTKKEFRDCQVHLEWRIPAGRKVKGQKGGNSGIHLMGRYEIQIQESHTNVTYADGQASAIYGQFPPLVNASAPQGEWQSYDIIFRAPRYNEKGMVEPTQITVIHNGVVTQNAKKLEGPTRHKIRTSYPKKHSEKAPISLQWHGDPIEYRNIWIREM